MDRDPRCDLVGLDRAAIEGALAQARMPANLAERVTSGIYAHGARCCRDLSGLGQTGRERLAAGHRIARPVLSRELAASDGTRKWLLRLEDGAEVETVFIPDRAGSALCISSQVGCSLACAFCHTGTQALVRNLSAGELLGQLLAARDLLDAWPGGAGSKPAKLVLMGMGEPLLNLDAVIVALRIALEPGGLALSRRRITVSTAGVVPAIERVGRELGVMLAISLHAVTDELRDQLVPINRRWPISELLSACRGYPAASNARRILFEYVLLDGVNDTPAEARELVRLLRGIPAKVNLIPFNPWPGTRFEPSSAAAVSRFAGTVRDGGLTASVRTPRGQEVLAACGQLRSETVRRRRVVATGRAGS